MKFFLDKWGGQVRKEDLINISMNFDIQMQIAKQYTKMVLYCLQPKMYK